MLAEAQAGGVCRRCQGKWYQRCSFVWWSSSLAELSVATFSRENTEQHGTFRFLHKQLNHPRPK